jgi:hypothetical protein
MTTINPALRRAPIAHGDSTSLNPGGMLARGDTGGNVTKLQQMLAASGFDPGGVDGDFGPNTQAAVKRFQTAHHLAADGIVGPKTLAALNGGSTFTPSQPTRPSGNTGNNPVHTPTPVNTTPPANDAELRQRMLSIAQNEVGTTERTNNNDGAVLKYPNYFGRGSEAYCADFVSWVSTQAGKPMNNPYVPSVKNDLVHSGRWKGKENPQPGDLVIFDWNHDGVGDHIGLVKSVNADGSINTIEGNTSGPNGKEGVFNKTRPMSEILGFGNP